MAVIGIHHARQSEIRTLPQVGELARLRTALCVWRNDLGGELDGWGCARSGCAGALVHSDGVLEWFVFRDANGRICWLLYRLPQSDAHAWDRLSRRLAGDREDLRASRERCPLWQKLYRHVTGERWSSSVLDLHAASIEGRSVLGATLRVMMPQSASSVLQALRHAGARWTLAEASRTGFG